MHIIQSIKGSQVNFFWCDARETALDFYKRLGMSPCSERFYKGDVPYYKMEVVL